MSDLTQTCFLCRAIGETTQEHVFPKWLQRKYVLWDQRVALKNATSISYRNLKIPCCRECNSTHLSNIEGRIRHLLDQGDVAVLRQNSGDVFVWLYKIMYGIRYKEMFLLNDRADVKSGPIVDPQELARRDSYTLFPLCAKGLVSFHGFSPYSIFVFNVTKHKDIKYYYASEPYKMWVSILLDGIGIVASFQDDGYIARDVARAKVLQGTDVLTISQFADFSSYILWLKVRMKMLPNYLMSTAGKRYSFRIQEPPPGPLYRPEKRELLESYLKGMFTPLFVDHMTDLGDGSRLIKYKSPFKYF